MEEYTEDPLIEFVTVDNNHDFDSGFANDEEIENPSILPHPQKIRKVVVMTNNGKIANKIDRTITIPAPQNNVIRKITSIKRIMPVARNSSDQNKAMSLRTNHTDEIHKKKTNAEVYQPQKRIPMSEEKVISLINAMEKEPCLWDKKHVHYKHKSVKNAAWNRVAQSIRIPLQLVQAKWLSLLGSFRHYRAKHLKYNDNKPNWFAYEALSFMLKEAESELKKSVIEKSSDSVYDDEPHSPEEHYESEEIEEEYLSQPEEELPRQNTSTKEETMHTVSQIPDDSSNAEILRIVRSMSKVLNKMANIGTPVDYGRYVNQNLEKYDEAIRIKTVKGIMELIAAADEEMVQKYPDKRKC